MTKSPCSVEGCDRTEYGKGLCNMHWQRLRKHGDVNHARRTRVGVEPCSIENCGRLVKARGWCGAHWTRWKRHGSPTSRVRGEVVDGKRICPDCGVDRPLSDWGLGQRICKGCAAVRTRAWRAENPYQPIAWMPCVCDACGQAFLGNAKRTRYCSQACAKADKNRSNWKYLNNRRARLRAVWVESFDRIEVFERDGWMCGICGDPVDPTVSYPDPTSASLDHVVPIALGGQHSRANAQCTHLGCNVRKGARLLQEVEAA